MDPHFDRRDVYIITQNALADGTYLQYIRSQYFRSAEVDPPFFQELLRGPAESREDYTTNFLAVMADQLLDKPLTARGARIEARWRKEGVYPPKEIYTPSPDDLQDCFSEYTQDVSRTGPTRRTPARRSRKPGYQCGRSGEHPGGRRGGRDENQRSVVQSHL